MPTSNLPSLMSLIASANPSECLLWPFGRDAHGYGRSTYKGKRQGVHRIAYIIANGNIPENLEAMHRCDNPPCFNPYHIMVGTHLDNIADMNKKGRGFSVLNETQVREIKQLWPSLSYNVLAKRYGVSAQMIGFMCVGNAWKHLPLSDEGIRLKSSGERPTLKGESAPSSKLTNEQVLEIRSMHGKLSQRKVALKYGLGKSTVGSIWRGEHWRHLLPSV